MAKYTVEYSSNNSGGSWWLKDEDWRALENAGWNVEWVKDQDYYDGDERWLGALAKNASIDVHSDNADSAMEAAIGQWESVSKQMASDCGCNCCGPPHRFSAENAEDDNNERAYYYGNEGWGDDDEDY